MIKNLSQLVLSSLVMFIVAGCASTPPPLERVTRINQDIYYGGVYLLAGSLQDIPDRFPVLYTPIINLETGLAFQLRDTLNKNRDAFTQINLKGFEGELAPDDGVIMALAFSSERLFSESVLFSGHEVTNLRTFVGGSYILQSFQRNPRGGFTVQLLGTFPFSYSAIDLVPPGKDLDDRAKQVLLGEELGIISSDFAGILSRIAPRVVPVTGLGATLQVRDVAIHERIHPFIGSQFGESVVSMSHWLAGELAAQLAAQIGIPIIPYAEDSSTRNLAVMLQSGEAFNILLPEPDFVMDVTIEGFSRRLAQETATEAVWVYGAYGTFRILESQTGIVRWEREVRHGVLKRVARSQVQIDHVAAEFTALLQLLSKVATELKDDNDARSLLEHFMR